MSTWKQLSDLVARCIPCCGIEIGIIRPNMYDDVYKFCIDYGFTEEPFTLTPNIDIIAQVYGGGNFLNLLDYDLILTTKDEEDISKVDIYIKVLMCVEDKSTFKIKYVDASFYFSDFLKFTGNNADIMRKEAFIREYIEKEEG